MTSARSIVRSALRASLAVALTFGVASCGPGDGPRDDAQPAGSDGWLTGDTHQKFDTLADQLGGFDQTMIEVGYRYVELYWAGQDENWPFARYQIEEMSEAIERGLTRRPARARSAEPFMNHVLPNLEEAAVKEDKALFDERFADLTRHCNVCHMMEAVPFIIVRQPTRRYHPWSGENDAETE